MNAPELDREFLRVRPANERATNFQSWDKLLFVHWAYDPDVIRSHLPPGLELDLHEGLAWISLVPFTIGNIRHQGLPPIPGLRTFNELNIRTYVHHKGVPGVWFFSLDAANALAVWAARRFYSLPYFRADMSRVQTANRISYRSHRTHASAAPATLNAEWEIGEPLPSTQIGSLEFFLTERYGLYSQHRGALHFCRVWHRPWTLRAARLRAIQSTMLEAAGLPGPAGEPLLHYSETLAVDIFRLRPAARPAA